MLSLRRPTVCHAVRRLSPPPLARALRQSAPEPDDAETGANDFILSILHASPSVRDTKSYMKSFNLQPKLSPFPTAQLPSTARPDDSISTSTSLDNPALASLKEQVSSILEPITRHTALVKIQGPFSDVQLESIARGMVYLEKLGLVSVIVVERDDWQRGQLDERTDIMEETLRVVAALEAQGARARPVLQAVARLGPKPGEELLGPDEFGIDPPEAHTQPKDLGVIRTALRAGEFPVLTPFALDSFCRTVRIDANYVIAALARGMVEAAELDAASASAASSDASSSSPKTLADFDLTPLRLMIINREGGIPSYARSGLPHLLVNLHSEFHHIQSTFSPRWAHSHPTALANLRLAQACLTYMPRTSSAVVVSHRSPKSLIANLITNKPAQSSSLPHALLSGPKKLTPHTPTIIRHGLPMRVVRNARDIDKDKMTALLEGSFGRVLGQEDFYKRLEKSLDFAIIAGDYAGAAIVTNEVEQDGKRHPGSSIAYLDKFAVAPAHQGDGTVDFLWVALHDESYGLGLASALNPNVGGRQGRGTGRDLVWRSRVDNPVNKWYFERASGHMRVPGGKWAMFWCDAEERLRAKEEVIVSQAEKNGEGIALRGRKWGVGGLSFVEDDERGRTERWSKIVEAIPSSWTG